MALTRSALRLLNARMTQVRGFADAPSMSLTFAAPAQASIRIWKHSFAKAIVLFQKCWFSHLYVSCNVQVEALKTLHEWNWYTMELATFINLDLGTIKTLEISRSHHFGLSSFISINSVLLNHLID